ncbi:hypothetical protein MPNT_80018 [Candidatus Methylacidithermus pantelleriae]|uniref:Uncharacterized protein n=1 Tax=Candidatus Methylacidithermus pantelleriae TaxID=2744239 RepID=A0A8J2BSR3_9BACT|nr:hypothetical protein MPNT_80018 [Candidatus Methylacidithermus pantelleriae]
MCAAAEKKPKDSAEDLAFALFTQKPGKLFSHTQLGKAYRTLETLRPGLFSHHVGQLSDGCVPLQVNHPKGEGCGNKFEKNPNAFSMRRANETGQLLSSGGVQSSQSRQDPAGESHALKSQRKGAIWDPRPKKKARDLKAAYLSGTIERVLEERSSGAAVDRRTPFLPVTCLADGGTGSSYRSPVPPRAGMSFLVGIALLPKEVEKVFSEKGFFPYRLFTEPLGLRGIFEALCVGQTAQAS